MQSKQTSDYRITRFLFQRALAFIYLIGFLIVVHQFIPLLGQDGLLPAKWFMGKVTFWKAPSLFWLNNSDTFFLVVGWCGIVLALLALTGISDSFGMLLSVTVWGLLWLFYLSFVNIGYVFYGFGWESILLETGFLAIFLGHTKSKVPVIIIWLFRWVLFRVMFGAGLIKLRGDPCWRDLTCMVYHYETQPIPNPLSWYLHKLPLWAHKTGVGFTHFVELIVPWGYFVPGLIVAAAGALSIFFQVMLIFSGNLSWLNYMTLVLCIPCFDDRLLAGVFRLKLPQVSPMSIARRVTLGALTCLILILSIAPAVNMISPRQMMNASFDPLHLVNTYGAFGSVTKKRNEIILEGTASDNPRPTAEWRAYEFKCKPGNVSRAPCLMSPYHYRLDWQVWFAAMTTYSQHPWILNLVAKLLENNQKTLSLIHNNPFPKDPPKHIRAGLYRYRFTTAEEREKTGAWWEREFVREYLPPLSVNNVQFQRALKQLGFDQT